MLGFPTGISLPNEVTKELLELEKGSEPALLTLAVKFSCYREKVFHSVWNSSSRFVYVARTFPMVDEYYVPFDSISPFDRLHVGYFIMERGFELFYSRRCLR